MDVHAELDLKRLRPVTDLRLVEQTTRGARFDTEAGPLAVEVYAPGIVRLRLGGEAGPDYGLLVGEPAGAAVDVRSADDAVHVEGDGVALELERGPLAVRLLRGGRRLLGPSTDAHFRHRFRLPPVARAEDGWFLALQLDSGEAVYGLGEQFGPLNRRGQLVVSWNDDALGVNAARTYKNTPFAWSPRGWGLFVHTPARVTHAVGYARWSHRSYGLLVEDRALDLFLLTAAAPGVLERYTFLTGRTPLPPRWSFGVWLSRAYYRTAAEALDAARGMRAWGFPCDVLTLDGRAWLQVDTRCLLEWDAERYPDPAAFVAELRAMGYRLCLWEYPYVSVHNPRFEELAAEGYFLRDAGGGGPHVFHWDPEPFGKVLTPLPPSAAVDFTNPAACAWWRECHRPLFEIGVDVMKTDFGEQVAGDVVAHNGDRGGRLHNVYPLLYNRCVFEASERAHGRGEALVWGRSGWAGSQRYPVQWGGDPQADWEGLAASIRGGLSWGMSGVPFYSHDIGGFYGGPPEPELYVRWVQAGVMSSHTRLHGIGPREPWHFGEEAERIVRDWFRRRYRLLPYLEACTVEAAETGLPVMRAMPLAFPGHRPAWAYEEQYLLGPALLVAPVLGPGGEVELYLPPGAWYDLLTGERLVGPRLLRLTVPLAELPVYGRGGRLLPLGPEGLEHTGGLPEETPIAEVWSFGRPHHGFATRHRRVTVEERSGGGRVLGLPEGTPMRIWGAADVAAEEAGGW